MADPSFLDCMFSYPSSAAGRSHCRKVIAISGLAVLGLYFVTKRTRSRILRNGAQASEGGMADGLSPADFDPQALARGTQIELEHTNDPAVAQRIAMDHLVVHPRYYELLAQMGL